MNADADARREMHSPYSELPLKWRTSYRPHRCRDRLEDVFQSVWYGRRAGETPAWWPEEYASWNEDARKSWHLFVRCMRSKPGDEPRDERFKTVAKEKEQDGEEKR